MKDKKIAVIGAGPAGITAALELKDKGCEDITIFGNFEEAQLKTLEVGGITFDVAACLLHTGYQQTVVRLCKRFGFEVNYLKHPADLVNQNLVPKKISISQKVETFLMLPFYFLFFFCWLVLHRTYLRRWFSIPMEQYLKRVGLDGLAQSFAMGPGGIAQGYGFLNEITAYHAFRWYRPRLFLTPLFSKFNKGVATITEGYEKLFRKIFQQFNNIPKKIKVINPRINKVELIDELDQRYYFDEVIVACPLNNLSFPHAFLLKEDKVEKTVLFSFLFTSPSVPTFNDRAYLTDLIQYKIKDRALVIRTGGKTDDGLYLYWAVGYKSEQTTAEGLKNTLTKQMEEECSLMINQIEFFKTYNYNLRFSEEAVSQGIPHKFDQLQGYKNIWYSSGLTSHWDISSIYENNKWIVNKLLYQRQPKTLWSICKFQLNNFLISLRLI